MTKSKKIIISVSVIIIMLVAILGTIFDLQISKALADVTEHQYYSTNFFAIIGECFGEDILYLFVMGACAVIFFYLLKFPLKQKWFNYCLQAGLCVVSYAVAVYSFGKTINYLALYTNFGLEGYVASALGKITILIVSAVISAGVFLIVNRFKPETIKNLLKWAILVIAVAVVSNGIVQVSKHIFDRTRFRAMAFVGDSDFSHFTYWFSINKNKFSSTSVYAEDFFKSFPSGHTCAAASVFLLAFLPYYLNNLNTNKNKIILWSVSVVFTLIVALSRIVAGAHFFMDTYIASLITVASVVILYFVIDFIFKKFNNKMVAEEQSSESTKKQTKKANEEQE